MEQAAGPRKDRRDWIRGRLAAFLVFPIVACDGAVCGLALDCEAVRRDELGRHHAERAETLREDVGLYVAVVVLGCPDEAAGGFYGLRDHVVDEAVLVVYARRLELLLVFPYDVIFTRQDSPSVVGKRMGNIRRTFRRSPGRCP